MKKYWWILIIVSIVLVLVMFIISSNLENKDSYKKQSIIFISDNSSQQNPEPLVNSDLSTGITVQTLSKHNSKSDCWIVYNNKVYDITSYLPRHPGGPSTITPTCGNTAFDSAFKNYHGTVYESRLLNSAIDMGPFAV
jgi:cytochrome b involved in lipid metabolism